jgi:hypothetical protein
LQLQMRWLPGLMMGLHLDTFYYPFCYNNLYSIKFYVHWLLQKSPCWWAASSPDVLLIYRYCVIYSHDYLF